MPISSPATQTMPATPGIVVAGTLDTKSAEIAYVRDQLIGHGLNVIIIDCGILGEPGIEATIDRGAVARAGGRSIDALRAGRSRELAIPTMIGGLETTVASLVKRGLVLGYLGLGGGTNASLAAAAFRQIPYGIPKMLISTVVSGDTRHIVGIKDVVLVHSVVDVLGLNGFLRERLGQACAALAGMVKNAVAREAMPEMCVAMTTFGSTTPAAMHAWQTLSAQNIEVLSFHARGIGGQAMEALVRAGRVSAVLDLTITEIADEIAGGSLSAGPDRLSAAGEMGIPQVVLPGSIDMVNFGPRETVPEHFARRRLAYHSALTTLMRTTRRENEAIAMFVADKLNKARGPAAVVLPLRGFSAYDIEGGPFFDPEADEAFCSTLTEHLDPGIPVRRLDAHINDPQCVDVALSLLLGMGLDTRQRLQGA